MYYPIIFYQGDGILGDVVSFQLGSTTNIATHSVTSWAQKGGNGMPAGGAIDCAYSPLLQVMCCVDGNTACAVSADAGQTWTASTVPSPGTGWSGVVWNGTADEFHMVGIGAAGSVVSSDGLSWTRYTSMAFDARMPRPCWIPPLGTTVCPNGVINILATPHFYTSTDGQTWTSSAPFNTGDCFCGIAWGSWVGGANGRLVTLTRRADSGNFPRKYYYSDNGGSTWNSGTSYAKDIDFSRMTSVRRLNMFIAIAGANPVSPVQTTDFLYSYDGITWSLGAMPSAEYWSDVMDTGSKLVAICENIASQGVSAVSDDGVTWSAGPTMATLGVEWKALGCTREIQSEV